MPGVDRELWLKRKEELRERLLSDLHIGYLDRDILDILLMFFERKESFTISSCSGRVVVVDAPLPWVRRESTVVFKKHEPIEVSELEDVLRQDAVHVLWLVVTGPIIHVSTASLREAVRVLRIAREAGMKHSGILSLSKKGIVVELKTGVRVAVPLKQKSNLLVSSDKLSELVDIANKALIEGKKRLEKLREVLARSKD
ncbi:MAG: hypothetical protein J7L12_03820 [Desulfurococcales archaeon]|nr:hypothetical protein [Desulfurococcales archaeon]